MIWFSADWHFGHEGILTHLLTRDVDFDCVEAMDDALIDGINAVVNPRDTLYFLGDFGWRPAEYGRYRSRLNVRELHVVRGNHDKSSLAHHCSTFNDMICRKFRVPGLEPRAKVHMCHYPILSWDAMHRGGIHLYGHCHGTVEKNMDKIHPNRRSMDVGIDNIHWETGEWRPISLDEIIQELGGNVTEERLPGPFESAAEFKQSRDIIKNIRALLMATPELNVVNYTEDQVLKLNNAVNEACCLLEHFDGDVTEERLPGSFEVSDEQR